MKKTIIFDFDNTLFNTQKMREELFDIFHDSGALQQKIEETYKNLRVKNIGMYDLHVFPKDAKNTDKNFLIIYQSNFFNTIVFIIAY